MIVAGSTNRNGPLVVATPPPPAQLLSDLIHFSLLPVLFHGRQRACENFSTLQRAEQEERFLPSQASEVKSAEDLGVGKVVPVQWLLDTVCRGAPLPGGGIRWPGALPGWSTPRYGTSLRLHTPFPT